MADREVLVKYSIKRAPEWASEMRRIADDVRKATAAEDPRRGLRSYATELREKERIRQAQVRAERADEREALRAGAAAARERQRMGVAAQRAEEAGARRQELAQRRAMLTTASAMRSVMSLTRSIAMMGMLGEESTDKLIRGLAKVQLAYMTISETLRLIVKLQRLSSAGGYIGTIASGMGKFALPAAATAAVGYGAFKLATRGPAAEAEASNARFAQALQFQSMMEADQRRRFELETAHMEPERRLQGMLDEFLPPGEREKKLNERWRKSVSAAERLLAEEQAAKSGVTPWPMVRGFTKVKTQPDFWKPYAGTTFRVPGMSEKEFFALPREQRMSIFKTGEYERPGMFRKNFDIAKPAVLGAAAADTREKLLADTQRYAEAEREREMQLENLRQRIDLLGQEKNAIKDRQATYALLDSRQQRQIESAYRKYTEGGMAALTKRQASTLLPWMQGEKQEKFAGELVGKFTPEGSFGKALAEDYKSVLEARRKEEEKMKNAVAENIRAKERETSRINELVATLEKFQAELTKLDIHAREVKIQTQGGPVNVEGKPGGSASTFGVAAMRALV